MSTSTAFPDREPIAQLQARLPSELAMLARLAFNYAWSWHVDGDALFRDLDPELWAACGHNPVRLLQETSQLELR
jgi:starch phosphorylase